MSLSNTGVKCAFAHLHTYTHTLCLYLSLSGLSQDDAMAAAALDGGDVTAIEQIPDDIEHATANYKMAVDQVSKTSKDRERSRG